MAETFAQALDRLWPHGDDRVPGLRAGIVRTAPAVFARFGIDSPLVLAHLMAQISHECGAGLEVVENLSYSAQRLTEVWPGRFPTYEAALPYEHNPKALANKVYGGRMANRVGTDDGWNFRGRGGSQTTGRDGYERVAKATGLDVVANPDLLIDPDHFLLCAVSDFVNCGCLPYAKADDVFWVTKRLNGGTVGLAERKAWLAKWKAADAAPPLAAAPASLPAPPQSVPLPKPAARGWADLIAAFIKAILSFFKGK